MSQGPVVLVGVDFSAETAAVLTRARLVAEHCDAALRLLHIVDREDVEPFASDTLLEPGFEQRVVAAAGRRLEELRGTLPADVRERATIEVAVGRVPEQCLRAAQTVELLVLGPRGTHPLRNLFLGSTADRLLRAAPCPVLVVENPPVAAYASAVLPVDDLDRARDALLCARRWAPEASLVAVHALRVPLESSLRLAGADDAAIARVRARARQEAARGFAALEPPRDPARWRLSVVEGDPTTVILKVVETVRADLIVIGKQGRAPWHEFLLGSVTRRVLATAPCDVLVLPPPRA